MLLPAAALGGNLAAVQAYLADADRDPDERGEDGKHLLYDACVGYRDKIRWSDGKRLLDVVRFLLARGAAPDALCRHRHEELTPLHALLRQTVVSQYGNLLTLARLLVDAGADPMLEDGGTTGSAFAFLLNCYEIMWNRGELDELLVMFLRASATYESLTSERVIYQCRRMKRSAATFRPQQRCLDLIDAVVAAGGTWRDYCTVPHKRLLRLRSLAARGRASPGPSTPPVVAQLFALPNGVLWSVLEHWAATR